MDFLKIWITIIICLGFQQQAKAQTTMSITQLQGLRTTIYKVDDLTAATDWYSKALGVKPYFNEPFYVGFNIGGYELGLLPEKVAEPKTTNILSYWGVEDITDAFDKMVTSGAKELEAPNDVGGGIKVALVKDPWKNVIGLIYNPHFKIALPEKSVVEWAAFTASHAATKADILKASKRLDSEFLAKQPGFIRRELLQKSETEFVDLIYWATDEQAQQAMLNAEKSEACAAYFSLMEFQDPANPNSAIQHFRVIPY